MNSVIFEPSSIGCRALVNPPPTFLLHGKFGFHLPTDRLVLMNPWQHHFQNVMRDGEMCFDGDDLSGAQEYFEEALSLIPEPKQKFAEATQVVVALADCLYRLGQYEKAILALDDALLCPGGAANPLIRLKRGQVLYRLGDAKKARLELTTAYLNGGPDVFEGNSGLLELIADVVAGLPKR